MIRTLLWPMRRLLHQHRPTEPTGRSGVRAETCRCGAARIVDCHRGLAVWSTRWTHDVYERVAALRSRSREAR